MISSRDGDPTATVLIDGHYYRPEDVEPLMEQRRAAAASTQKLRDGWLETPHGQTCKELYDKFQAYKALVEKSPYGTFRADGACVHFEEHQLFAQALGLMQIHMRERALTDKQNLEKARNAARCTHLMGSGERCRAPRVKRRALCHMHERMLEARAVKLDLPPLEDANSIQLAIMKLQKVVIDGTLDHKQIGYLSNLIQIAAWNVSRTNFGGQQEDEG
jgi:hypothetical protein